MDIKAELLKIAASIIKNENMPSIYVEDWPIRMTAGEKERIGNDAFCQCQYWAAKIRIIVDELSKYTLTSAST